MVAHAGLVSSYFHSPNLMHEMATLERRKLGGGERSTLAVDGISSKLTPQEFRIFHFLKTTRVNKEIAAILGISHSTTKNHIQEIYRKAGITNGRVEFWTRFGFEPLKGIQ